MEQLCAAYATKLPDASVFTAVTAARLWRFPLPAYLGDHSGREPVAPSSVSALEAAITRRGSSRGVAALRSALGCARLGSWSRTVTLTRLVLMSVGIPEPTLNRRLRIGSAVVHLDMAWPDARLSLEYDGDHHRGRAQFVADVARQEAIQDHGWVLIRITQRELFDGPADLVQRVARRLVERGVRDVRLELRRMVRMRR